jgi:hypothetical protein
MTRLLASRRWRIFLVAWLLYSVHFATNVVREHYPAFSLVEHGTFRVDEYQGFHSDIFVHRDGHSVIGNQVLVSTLAAIPLWVFDPVLDALERHSLGKLEAGGVRHAEYRTDKPMRREFFRLVKERGLDLRFGAATAITVIFFMAPITAAFLAFFYGVLRGRGASSADATTLAFVLGFGTPLLFRATNLNHNLFVMYAMFIAFALLWVRPGGDVPIAISRRLAAGFFGGVTLATDYIGVIILPLLYGYLVLPRLRTASWRQSLRESLPMIAGSLPPIAFLCYSQWAMYGHPFLPGQHWMPDQNVYVHEGMRGFTLPDPELFLQNLFHPGFGLFVWAPILALAFVPTHSYAASSLILPRRERWFVAASVLVFLIFCSMNQYARLQWNSGFRYLVPVVPFLVLALSDHWVRLPRLAQGLLAGGAVLHSWVLTVFREPAHRSWSLFFEEGPQLPWYRVLGMTAAPGTPYLNTWWVPAAILAATIAVSAGLWHYGATLETRQHGRVS